MNPKSMSNFDNTASIEAAISTLEAAKARGSIPDHLQARINALGVVRSDLKGALKSTPTPSESSGGSHAGPAVIIPLPKEVLALTRSLRLEERYADAIDTQKTFQLLRPGEKVPDFAQVLKVLTPESIAAVQCFQSPDLILRPKGRSFKDLIAAMDGHKTMPGQNNTHVDAIFKDQHAHAKPEQCGAHLIEAPNAINVHEFDNTSLILSARLLRMASHKKATGVKGMDRWKYALLMMQKIKKGEPIDINSWTMLDEDPALSNVCVPSALWNGDWDCQRVDFYSNPPELEAWAARLRRSVGGNVSTT